MICNKCGKDMLDSTNCPYCNNEPTINVLNSTSMNQNSNKPVVGIEKVERKEFDLTKIALILLLIVMIGAVVVVIQAANGNLFYFSEASPEVSNEAVNEVIDMNTEHTYVAVSKSGQDGKITGEGQTSVIYDNQYLKQTILKTNEEMDFFLKLDSDNNGTNCSSEIKQIENNIENNYGITAVNLCEMDVTFAKEIENVAAYIYNNYPTARGRITNLTLANVDKGASYMAAFMPVFTFVTSNTNSSYPLGIKTQIILNAKFFLKPSKVQTSATYGAASGYFPKNATRSSTVAHEFGHYLSYVAMMNYYKTDNLTFVRTDNAAKLNSVYDDFAVGSFSNMVIKKAYEKYQKDYNGKLSYDDFRGSISKYALAKNASGAYIYDETIAEAFHDCYLNGDSAQLASKLIMEALNEYL